RVSCPPGAPGCNCSTSTASRARCCATSSMARKRIWCWYPVPWCGASTSVCCRRPATTAPRGEPCSYPEVSVAAVDAAAGAGLADHHPAQGGEGGFQFPPDPAGDVFAGGVFEAFDVVEKTVVEALQDGLEHRLDIGEIHQPAAGFPGLPSDVQGHLEGVAMEAAALVARRYVGQEVGGFEAEFLEDFHGGRGGETGRPWYQLRALLSWRSGVSRLCAAHRAGPGFYPGF